MLSYFWILHANFYKTIKWTKIVNWLHSKTSIIQNVQVNHFILKNQKYNFYLKSCPGPFDTFI